MDSHEDPIVAGVTNLAPFLEGLVERGIQRYGTNFVSGPNTMASGEGGTYRRLGIPVFTTMQGPPMYHTTGESWKWSPRRASSGWPDSWPSS